MTRTSPWLRGGAELLRAIDGGNDERRNYYRPFGM